MTVTIEECKDVELLRPLAEEWLSEAHPEEFGLSVDMEVVKADMELWMAGDGVVLIARDDDDIVGFLAAFIAPSYLNGQKILVEKYWYTRKGSLFAGPRLYAAVIVWAENHGCSHVLTSGSKMASDRHDSICQFLEMTGAQHFETSYLYRLGDA